jgi:hypothetical protein
LKKINVPKSIKNYNDPILVFPGIVFAEVLTKISWEDEPCVCDASASKNTMLPPQEVTIGIWHHLPLVKKKCNHDDKIATITVMDGWKFGFWDASCSPSTPP